MTDKQIKLVRKFLDFNFSNLELGETRKKTHQTLSRRKGKIHIFLISKEQNEVYVNSKIVIDPMLKMFNTDYNETYKITQEWLLEKYELDCIDLVGVKIE